MSTVRKLPDDHPYVRQFTATVRDLSANTGGRRGGFAVGYRDFSTLKQDPEFPDFASARAFAEKLAAGPHLVWDDELDGETFEDLTAFWAGLDTP